MAAAHQDAVGDIQGVLGQGAPDEDESIALAPRALAPVLEMEAGESDETFEVTKITDEQPCAPAGEREMTPHYKVW